MDTEALKLLISITSAVVAVSSAYVAFRTRKQTRLDLFETQRDVLILAMSENDIRLRTLEFRITVLHTQLREALTASADEPTQAVERTLNSLAELGTVIRSLQRRDWCEDQVRCQQYTEEALLELRRRTVNEQITARTIQAEAHTILIEHARAELDRLKAAV